MVISAIASASFASHVPRERSWIYLNLFLVNVLVVVFNSLIITSLLKAKSFQKSSSAKYFVLSLSISDLIVGLIVMPFGIISLVMNTWIFGGLWCELWQTFDFFSCTASILNLCTVSIDRYIAISRPLLYASWMTTHRVLGIIVCVWLCAAIITFPPVIAHRLGFIQVCRGPQCTNCNSLFDIYPAYTLFASWSSFYLPLSVVVFTNYRTYLIVRQHMSARDSARRTSTKRWTNQMNDGHLSPPFAPARIGTCRRTGLRLKCVPKRPAGRPNCLIRYKQRSARCCNTAAVLFCGCICWRRLIHPPASPLVCTNDPRIHDCDPEQLSSCPYGRQRGPAHSTLNSTINSPRTRMAAQRTAARMLNTMHVDENHIDGPRSISDSDEHNLIWSRVRMKRMDRRGDVNNNHTPTTSNKPCEPQHVHDASIAVRRQPSLGVTLIQPEPEVKQTNQCQSIKRKPDAIRSLSNNMDANEMLMIKTQMIKRQVIHRHSSADDSMADHFLRPSSLHTSTTTASLGQLSRSSQCASITHGITNATNATNASNTTHATNHSEFDTMGLPFLQPASADVIMAECATNNHAPLVPYRHLRRLSAPVPYSPFKHGTSPAHLPAHDPINHHNHHQIHVQHHTLPKPSSNHHPIVVGQQHTRACRNGGTMNASAHDHHRNVVVMDTIGADRRDDDHVANNDAHVINTQASNDVRVNHTMVKFDGAHNRTARSSVSVINRPRHDSKSIDGKRHRSASSCSSYQKYVHKYFWPCVSCWRPRSARNNPFRASGGSNMDPESRRFGNGAKREYKATRTLLSITCVFIICWLPYYVCFTLESFCPGCLSNASITSNLLWLGWSNSGINPIIYMCLSKKIRYSILKTVFFFSTRFGQSRPLARPV